MNNIISRYHSRILITICDEACLSNGIKNIYIYDKNKFVDIVVLLQHQ